MANMTLEQLTRAQEIKLLSCFLFMEDSNGAYRIGRNGGSHVSEKGRTFQDLYLENKDYYDEAMESPEFAAFCKNLRAHEWMLGGAVHLLAHSKEDIYARLLQFFREQYKASIRRDLRYNTPDTDTFLGMNDSAARQLISHLVTAKSNNTLRVLIENFYVGGPAYRCQTRAYNYLAQYIETGRATRVNLGVLRQHKMYYESARFYGETSPLIANWRRHMARFNVNTTRMVEDFREKFGTIFEVEDDHNLGHLLKSIVDSSKIRFDGLCTNFQQKIDLLDRIFETLPELLLVPIEVMSRCGGCIHDVPLSQHPDFSAIFHECTVELYEKYVVRNQSLESLVYLFGAA